jgi:hypothetical protein
MNTLRKKQEQDAHTIVMRKIVDFIERNKDLVGCPDYGDRGIYLSKSPHFTEKFLEEDIKNNPENINLWSWKIISRHQNITMEFIQKHPEYPWDWNEVSRNPNLTSEFIEKYPEYEWDWKIISRHDNISMEFVEKHPEYPWDWNEVSKNPNLTFNMVIKYPEKKWFWQHILESNTTIPFDNLDEYIETWNMDMFSLSGNPAITVGFIIKYKKDLNWERITSNSSITMDIIEAYPELPWKTGYIKYNPNVTPEFILKYPDYDWGDMETNIYHNKNITPEFIVSHPELGLEKYITFCSNLTPEFVREHIDYCWDWSAILSQFEITPEFIENYRDYLKCWWYPSNSPYISMNYINENGENNWYWYTIMQKEFRIEFNEELEKIVTRDKRKYATINNRLLLRRAMGLGN